MKKFLIITLTVLIVALVGTGIYAYSLLNGITRTSLAESTLRTWEYLILHLRRRIQA